MLSPSPALSHLVFTTALSEDNLHFTKARFKARGDYTSQVDK